MAVYYVHGTTASALAANVIIAQLWNPHASRRIKVVEVSYGISGDTGSSTVDWVIQRTSARGATPAATATPGAVDADDNAAAPPSGAVLEFATFGTPPTAVSPPLYAPLVQVMAATATQPFFLAPFPRGIWVPPGTGLAVAYVSTEGFVGNQAGFVFED